MKHVAVLHRIAEKEFDDAIGWYEGQREGLGHAKCGEPKFHFVTARVTICDGKCHGLSA